MITSLSMCVKGSTFANTMSCMSVPAARAYQSEAFELLASQNVYKISCNCRDDVLRMELLDSELTLDRPSGSGGAIAAESDGGRVTANEKWVEYVDGFADPDAENSDKAVLVL